MKKRRVLRNWVEQVLVLIFAIGFLLGGSDSDMTLHFVIVHIIAAILMIIPTIILLKYGREN